MFKIKNKFFEIYIILANVVMKSDPDALNRDVKSDLDMNHNILMPYISSYLE